MVMNIAIISDANTSNMLGNNNSSLKQNFNISCTEMF